MKNIKLKSAISIIEVLVIVGIISLVASIVIPAIMHEHSEIKTAQINQITLSSDGELVGKLKDGRIVRRFKIANEDNRNHWVYIVEDNNDKSNSTISNNYVVPYGKSRVNETEVIINGKKYNPEK